MTITFTPIVLQILLEMDSLIIGSSSTSCSNGTDPFRSVDASSSLAQQEELDLIASTGRLKRLEAGYEVHSQKNVIFEGKFDFKKRSGGSLRVPRGYNRYVQPPGPPAESGGGGGGGGGGGPAEVAVGFLVADVMEVDDDDYTISIKVGKSKPV